MDVRMAKEFIRMHWLDTAEVMDILDTKAGRGQAVDQEALEQGELGAAIFTVGCYMVRNSIRYYRVHEPGYSPELEFPATDEEMEPIKKEMSERFSFGSGLGGTRQDCSYTFAGGWEDTLRCTTEISVRHFDSSDGKYTYLCRASSAGNYSWAEEIQCVFVARESGSISNQNASLFVCNEYVGSSFSSQTWYKFDRMGRIEPLELHDMDPDKDKKSLKGFVESFG